MWARAEPGREVVGCLGRVRRRTGGADAARAGFVNPYDLAWMPARVRDGQGGQGGLRPVGRAAAVTKRTREANAGGRGLGAVRWWLGRGGQR